MELCKDSTSLKLSKSMEKIRSKYGEEASISLLQNLKTTMQGILKTIRDIKT
jgi:hypothetical protein